MESFLSLVLGLISCVSGSQASGRPAIPPSLKGKRCLGSGAFGTVVRVGKQAVKVVECEGEEHMEEVQEECAAMNRAASVSSNVIKAHRFWTEGSFCCIAMDACKGTLSDWLHYTRICRLPAALIKGPCPSFGPSERQCLELFEQMVGGVAACHQQGMVHCDIKPQNFLLASFPATWHSSVKPGTVKLTDFGLATSMGGCSEVRIEGGTAEFAAPEVVAFLKGDCVADVWGLGVCLLRMLDGDTRKDLSDMHWDLRRERGFWGRRSEATKALLQGMLNKDPTKRLSSEEAHKLVLQHPLLVNRGADAAAIGRRCSRVAPGPAHV